MSAELLREAAVLMRERSEAATDGRWRVTHDPLGTHVETDLDHMGRIVAGSSADRGPEHVEGDADHIAAADPTVMLAVAGWLDSQADVYHFNEKTWTAGAVDPRNRWAERGLTVEDNLAHHFRHALAVARAYLRNEVDQ